jgi:hypothetical protein
MVVWRFPFACLRRGSANDPEDYQTPPQTSKRPPPSSRDHRLLLASAGRSALHAAIAEGVARRKRRRDDQDVRSGQPQIQQAIAGGFFGVSTVSKRSASCRRRRNANAPSRSRWPKWPCGQVVAHCHPYGSHWQPLASWTTWPVELPGRPPGWASLFGGLRLRPTGHPEGRAGLGRRIRVAGRGLQWPDPQCPAESPVEHQRQRSAFFVHADPPSPNRRPKGKPRQGRTERREERGDSCGTRRASRRAGMPTNRRVLGFPRSRVGLVLSRGPRYSWDAGPQCRLRREGAVATVDVIGRRWLPDSRRGTGCKP